MKKCDINNQYGTVYICGGIFYSLTRIVYLTHETVEFLNVHFIQIMINSTLKIERKKHNDT